MQACPRSLDEQLKDLLLGKTERGSDGTGDSKRASAGSDGMSSGQVQSSRLRECKAEGYSSTCGPESGLESGTWDGLQ